MLPRSTGKPSAAAVGGQSNVFALLAANIETIGLAPIDCGRTFGRPEQQAREARNKGRPTGATSNKETWVRGDLGRRQAVLGEGSFVTTALQERLSSILYSAPETACLPSVAHASEGLAGWQAGQWTLGCQRTHTDERAILTVS